MPHLHEMQKILNGRALESLIRCSVSDLTASFFGSPSTYSAQEVFLQVVVPWKVCTSIIDFKLEGLRSKSKKDYIHTFAYVATNVQDVTS